MHLLLGFGLSENREVVSPTGVARHREKYWNRMCVLVRVRVSARLCVEGGIAVLSARHLGRRKL